MPIHVALLCPLGVLIPSVPATASPVGVIDGPAPTVRDTVFFASDGTVSFTSSTPLNEFSGRSEVLTGRVDFGSRRVSFFVDVATLDSGNRRRDRDMRRNYLQTDQFPFALFEGTVPEGVDPDQLSSTPVRVRGTFTLRGVERPVEVEGRVSRVSGGIELTARWTLRLSEYGIERPRILFYEVSEEQRIEVRILLRPEPPAASPAERTQRSRVRP